AFSERVMHSLGTGLITTDSEGCIYLFNRAAQQMTGIRAEEATNRKIGDLFPDVLEKTGSPHFETSMTRKDGITLNLRFSVSPVMIDEQNTAGYVWCFDDITELRVLERQIRQKEQMAAIGVMSAGIAHEIRNPLA